MLLLSIDLYFYGLGRYRGYSFLPFQLRRIGFILERAEKLSAFSMLSEIS